MKFCQSRKISTKRIVSSNPMYNVREKKRKRKNEWKKENEMCKLYNISAICLMMLIVRLKRIRKRKRKIERKWLKRKIVYYIFFIVRMFSHVQTYTQTHIHTSHLTFFSSKRLLSLFIRVLSILSLRAWLSSRVTRPMVKTFRISFVLNNR